jgi:hypothetical protein
MLGEQRHQTFTKILNPNYFEPKLGQKKTTRFSEHIILRHGTQLFIFRLHVGDILYTQIT